MTRQEEIAEMAQKAAELVRDLETLRQQAGHYSAAKEELKATRGELAQLIEGTKTLAVHSHQVLAHLNEIGAGKIFEQLDEIQKRQKRMLIGCAIGFGILVVLMLLLLVRSLH